MAELFLFVVLWHCLILVVLPWLLITNHSYNDGVIGRFFLGMISVFAGAMFMEGIVAQSIGSILYETGFLVICFTWFIGWHVTRFYIRLARCKPKTDGKERRSGAERRFVEATK